MKKRLVEGRDATAKSQKNKNGGCNASVIQRPTALVANLQLATLRRLSLSIAQGKCKSSIALAAEGA
jgi:hypothetical protein